MIYFIQSDENGLIKIGSSTDPERRLRELQTSSNAPLRILLTLPGTSEEEALLHERFRNYRQQGEWYLPLKELLDFIYNPVGEMFKWCSFPLQIPGMQLPEIIEVAQRREVIDL